MRYIPKQQEPAVMKEWKEEQVNHALPLLYDIFPGKKELNEPNKNANRQKGINAYRQNL